MPIDGPETWQQHVSAIQAGVDAGIVDAAICALRPLIEETAERVCRRRMVSKQIRTDFVADSAAELLGPRESRDGTPRGCRLAQFDRTTGPFPGWLNTVLDNLLKDRLRGINRRAKHERTSDVTEVNGPDSFAAESDQRQSKPDDHLDSTLPFSSRDLQQIEQWPVLDRVLLLTVFELWRKIPAETWDIWCREAELPDPFPPEPEIPRERGEWVSLIAQILSTSPNALQNRLRRRLEQLRREPLGYVQGIQND